MYVCACVCVARKSNNTHTLRCLACKICLLWFRLNRLLISAYAAGSAAPRIRPKKMLYFKCPPNTLTHTNMHTHTHTATCRQAAHALAFGGWFNAQHRQILTFALKEHAPLTDACHLGHPLARGEREYEAGRGDQAGRRGSHPGKSACLN